MKYFPFSILKTAEVIVETLFKLMRDRLFSMPLTQKVAVFLHVTMCSLSRITQFSEAEVAWIFRL